MLQHDGVNTNRLRKLNNFHDVQAIKNTSFDGLGCDKVLARFDEYLKLGLHLPSSWVSLSTSTLSYFIFQKSYLHFDEED